MKIHVTVKAVGNRMRCTGQVHRMGDETMGDETLLDDEEQDRCLDEKTT